MSEQSTKGSHATPETIKALAPLVSGKSFWETREYEALEVDSLFLSDGPNGVRKQVDAVDHLGLSGAMQATCFPSTSLIASSWDPDLIRETGKAIARDARRLGVDVLLAPGLNLRRNPLCGRNFEYYSEDPFLSGSLASAFIGGLQEMGVGACVKHFACNNQEDDRLSLDVKIDERTMRELYLTGFEIAVHSADPWMLMTAYNRVNGDYCSENELLLQKVLRGEWSYAGVVVCDWGGVDDRVRSLELGLDLEMPDSGTVNTDRIIEAALKDENIAEALHASVSRLQALSEKVRSGKAGSTVDGTVSGSAIAQKIAEQSMVLLRNENEVLPLGRDGELLVIGPFAKTPRIQGNGSSRVSSKEPRNFLDVLADKGIRHTYIADVKALRAARDALKIDVQNGRYSGVVVLAGLPEGFETEGRDRTTIDLPEDDLALIELTAELTDKAVVVLINGGNVAMPFATSVSAILECYLPGEMGMEALERVVFGDVSPSGKLTESVYAAFRDCSCFTSHPSHAEISVYKDGIFVGYRHVEKFGTDVTYPFGHGLAYTQFEVSNSSIDLADWAAKRVVHVKCSVTNTGEREGAETVQVYVSKPDLILEQAPIELIGFQKVWLKPKGRKDITITLFERRFMSFDPDAGQWIMPGRDFGISLGTSSRKIVFKTEVELESASFVPPKITRNTTFGTAMKYSPNPDVVREYMQVFLDESGIDFDLGAPDEQFKWDVVSDFPLRALVTFSKGKFSYADLETMVLRMSA